MVYLVLIMMMENERNFIKAMTKMYKIENEHEYYLSALNYSLDLFIERNEMIIFYRYLKTFFKRNGIDAESYAPPNRTLFTVNFKSVTIGPFYISSNKKYYVFIIDDSIMIISNIEYSTITRTLYPKKGIGNDYIFSNAKFNNYEPDGSECNTHCMNIYMTNGLGGRFRHGYKNGFFYEHHIHCLDQVYYKKNRSSSLSLFDSNKSKHFSIGKFTAVIFK